VDEHVRLVDVGPTLAALAGVPHADLTDGAGEPLDGGVLTAYLDGEASVKPKVIGILWDGAHCGDLLHLAESGELPGIARLINNGVALRGGAVAQFPSITLTNHTSILTGVGPGRHGVLGNVFYDRATGERVVPNDASTWHRSAERSFDVGQNEVVGFRCHGPRIWPMLVAALIKPDLWISLRRE